MTILYKSTNFHAHNISAFLRGHFFLADFLSQKGLQGFDQDKQFHVGDILIIQFVFLGPAASGIGQGNRIHAR